MFTAELDSRSLLDRKSMIPFHLQQGAETRAHRTAWDEKCLSSLSISSWAHLARCFGRSHSSKSYSASKTWKYNILLLPKRFILLTARCNEFIGDTLHYFTT